MSRDAATNRVPPSPALLAKRRPPAPPSRTHVPAPRTRYRPLLDRTPADLLCGLAIAADDPRLRERVAFVVGGDDTLAELEDPVRRGEAVGRAWKGCLDFVEDGARPDDPAVDLNHVLIIVMLHVHASFGAPGTVVTRSLNEQGLGWLGTWRELNIRLGDKLYRHAVSCRRAEAGGQGEGARAAADLALHAALQCWEVVEILSGRDTDDQRRRWRGMRGIAHVWIARRGEHPHAHLRDAIRDLEVAEECGDRTPQHYALLVEACLRAHVDGGGDAMLNRADESLRRARQVIGVNVELATATGDLHRLRGLGALARAGIDVARHPSAGEVEAGLDDVDAFETAGFCGTPGPLDQQPALRAAQSAFLAASAWYTYALSLPGGRPEHRAIRIRRGQARVRLAQARCRLGRPYAHLLEAALPDLRLCHAGIPICADYLPWALFEYARSLAAAGRMAGGRPGAGSANCDTVRRAADEALAYVRRRLPEGHVLERKLSELAGITGA